MERQRGYKIVGIVALIVAVMGLTIAFASLSSTLTVRGAATAGGDKYDIRFVDNKPTTPVVSPVRTTGASSDNTVVVSNDGLTLTYQANLKTPGNKVTYTAKIRNYGTIDGEIATITNNLVTGDSAKASKLLNIDIRYTSDNKAPSVGDIIKPGQANEEEITIEVTYNKDISNSDLPSTNEAYVYQYTINYVQASTVAQNNIHTDTSQQVQETLYNISVNDLSNVDLDSHFFQGYYAFGFVDQNGIQHAFTIVHVDESEEYYFLAYLPDLINYPETAYFYDDEANNWFETVDDVVTGNTLETESLVFSNVSLASDEEYEQYYPKFTSQMLSDIFTITEVE